MIGVTETERPRGAARVKLFQPTTLHGAGAPRRAHLLDLSISGALVHALEPPAVGGFVRIEVAGEARIARVAWSRGKRFGIRFAMPLTASQVVAATKS